MYREPKGKKIVETDRLTTPTVDADEAKMDVQKGCGAKDTSGPFFSKNPPISVAAPKPLPSDMDSRSFLPTKTPSFV